ncbi:MAG: pyridoxal phosphate-dependent aminotransferase [Desulfobacterales bacterium]|nr:pyridoxal phosphate-dependent aminotransferase [Desulfobacterales bacterium]MBF0398041.1 pyridoxal phosphate-dependent aminotransferase [Desulfobacterales bacterium]
MYINETVSLNLNVRGMDKSPTIAINDLSNELKKKGKKIYRLGLGQSPFPVPSPVVDALKENAHQKDYLPAEGLPILRQAVANFHRKKNNVEILPENVLIGPGSKELMFLLQLVYYGELIVPTPCWVSYVPQANILGRKVILLNSSFEKHWKILAKDLETYCASEKDSYRPRILILNYPSNPDGCTYTIDQLKELAEVARKFRVILLSDEIYGEIHHQGKHISIAKFYPEGTIISSGLSKWCGAGGWRLGTFAFPPDLYWLLESMASVASETFTSTSAPIQFAAVRAFEGEVRIERYLWHVRRILSHVGNKCHKILSDGKIKVLPPEGGFYLFLDFTPFAGSLAKLRGINNSKLFCEKLLYDTGVAALPGEAFGRPPEELTVRIAYVDFDGSKTLTASENIPLDQPLPDDFADHWCCDLMKAMNIIVEWINKG